MTVRRLVRVSISLLHKLLAHDVRLVALLFDEFRLGGRITRPVTLLLSMNKKHTSTALAVPIERIENHIYLIRGEKVMLDADLAELYQVLTKNLNKSVRRNFDRFPQDFMFQLTKEEFDNLRLQIGTSSSGYGGRRYLPYVFTELGVAMLSSVLNSQRAVQMNILIMRAFVKLRELIASHKDLADRIEKLESNQDQHASVINILAAEIDNLKMPPPEPPRKRIGFVADDDPEGEKISRRFQ